jgi:hypothetical protein
LRTDVDREIRFQVPLHHVGGLVGIGSVSVSPAIAQPASIDAKAG